MKKYLFKFVLALIFLVVVILLSLKFGRFTLSLADLKSENLLMVFNLRVTRIILAMIAGISLSLCGILYQSMLINPLAEPYLLGVSAGGALGAVFALLIESDYLFLLAMLGALIALGVVYAFANKRGHFDNTGMILSGVMVNAFCSALIMLIVAVAGTKVNSMMFWLMGDIGSGELGSLWLILPVLFLLITISIVFNRSIDALSFGDEDATYLGVDVRILKIMIFSIASFLTALIVATVGIIGFVGLVIPHIAKMLTSEHLGEAFPFVIVLGAGFMVFADFLSRVLVPGMVLPVGIITALIGVPFFVVVYKRS